jgi:hypothetical protein
VHLSYGKELELRILLPPHLDDVTSGIVHPIRDRPITDLPDLLKGIRQLEAHGVAVTAYPKERKPLAYRRFGPRPHRAAWAGNHAITVRRWELCRSQFRILGCKNLAPTN